ncbi:MAG: hypothetical protein HKO59_11035 [Phycisphaerales bacterium]|nr:hypothetical protein [Phycisphaerae bacterium]NNF44083.1 hypothetical protein [Phycisphaerales bacterium]NNM26498.1 hypothetical protein [Phycisphaerales bacterium]
MAEAVAQRWLDEGELGRRVLAASAGVAAGTGMPPSIEVERALEAVGITVDGRSKPLTAEMIRAARVLFVMTPEHAAAARDLVAGEPEQLGKIHLLDPATPITDPIGQGQAAYDELLERFRTLIPRRLREVFADEDRAGIGSSRN